ncbi:EAL domain-containing protein [Shewanella cyperi]|uniref:EAL domain-containing protein n=1 Tax=Shewanella cyperi TaxID=2814292 RepID=UPI001A94FC9E|nr:EAL domain-containing protein [Shewanella cyperi]QSX40521.1 EAL domain-containing protein [Shewanella cyperi]
MIRKAVHRLMFLLLCCCAGLQWANAGELVQRVFAARDGLANGVINDISFDQYGFAWLATEDGLYRVSNTKVRRIDKKGLENRLSNAYVNQVIPLDKENLLVGVNQDIYRYHIPSDSFQRIGSPEFMSDYPGGGIMDATRLPDARLLLLTNAGQLLELDYRHWQIHSLVHLQQDKDRPWKRVLRLEDGRILLASFYQLQLRTSSGEKLAQLPWNETSGQIKSLFADKQQRLWMSSSEGLFRIELDKLQITAETRVPYYCTHMVEDGNGHFWIASRAGLLKWVPGQEPTTYKDALKQEADIEYIHDMEIDSAGLLWVGGTGEGLAIVADTPKFILDKFDGDSRYKLANEMIWSVYTEGSRVWLGSDAGLMTFERGKDGSRLLVPDDFELNDSVYNITPLNGEYLLLSTTNGLYVVNKTSFTSQRFEQWSQGNDSLRHKLVFSTYRDPAIPGRIWFVTATGLFFWEPGLFNPAVQEIKTREGQVLSPSIQTLLRDSTGRLWLGGEGEFGYLDKDGYFVSKLALFDGLSGTPGVSHLLEPAPGVLWIGSGQMGLLEYHGDTGLVQPLGQDWRVDCSSIFFLRDIGEYRLIGCPRSLIRQHKLSGKVSVYSVTDGLVASELNESAVYFHPDQGLYLGTPDGAVLVDVNQLSNRFNTDKVSLESVTVYFDEHSELQLVPEQMTRVAPGARMVSLQLTSHDLLDDSPLRVKYRLRRPGDLGQGSYLLLDGQTQINLSGLTAGMHLLEVLSQSNGIWSEVPLSYRLQVEQYWWQTPWFKWALVLFSIIMAIGAAFARQKQVSRFRRINQALLESEDRLRQSLKGSESDLWEWRADTDHFYLDNRGGVLGSHAEMIERPVKDIPIHPDDRERVETLWSQVAKGELPRFEAEYRFQRQDGHWGWLRVRGRPTRHSRENGLPEQISGIYSDITQQRQLQDEVDLLAQAFENTSEGVLILDAAEKIKVANRAAQTILGETADSLLGRSFVSLVSERSSEQSEIRELLGHGQSWTGERELRVAAGQVCPVWLNVSAMLGAEDKIQHYVVVFSDITERKRSEADLRRLANYDVLTGLPNRSLFSARLNQAIHKATLNDGKLALMFLDLDRFKHVNDSFGHSMGDALLVEAANRLQSCMEPEQTLCRFGGDEFVVLINQGTDLDSLNHLAESMLRQIEMPFRLYGREFFISTSIGISIWPDDARQPEALIKNADLAMYHAKDEGRGNFQYYSEERNAEALYHLKLETDLRKALEREEFELYYQPQIDVLKDDAVVGVEALIRWRHPKDGFVRPDVFIKVAEACGLVIDIDKWVLRRACLDGARWARLAKGPFKVSVNVSAIHFRQADFISHLQQTLAETGMPIANLALEITEGVLMKELQVARQHLQQLKSMGVDVAIDDFGTGYSSLAYLRHFDVNTLKIDRSFLIDIATNEADQAIVSSIIELARNLKLNVVAEGIETKEQLEQVFSRGCHTIQGYYFAKPMPLPELDNFIGLDES